MTEITSSPDTIHPENAITPKRKPWEGVLKIIIIIYCLIGIAFYYLQDKFLFHPIEISAESALNIPPPFKEINIKADENYNYNIVQFSVADSIKKGVILYFHGNTGNVEYYAEYAPIFTNHGYEIWMVDYPGFGKSTGELTEKALYDEALQFYKLARSKYSPDSIILYGKSLGTGIATQLASVRDCKRLILETPYYSIPTMASVKFWMFPVNQMLKYKLPTYEFLQKVTAPVTIFHGTKDNVIAFSNAKRLKPLMKTGDEFITIENGEHNDLFDYPMVTEKLAEILK